MKIKVLVVDDSALIRRLVTELLERDPGIEVVGTAADPYAAREKILALRPDVVTLDLEMPKMDGLTFLEILMKHQPLPVVILSSFTKAGSDHAVQALHLGAVDVLGKPGDAAAVRDLGPELVKKVTAAAQTKMENLLAARAAPLPPLNACRLYNPRQVVLLGASTGGTEALRAILPILPREMPGICIVQHIPAHFSRAFAERLDSLCQIDVREAAQGDWVEPGLALLAPGDRHIELVLEKGRHRVRLTKGEPVWHQRPAVDVLFHSAVACGGAPYAVAGLLTGMGKDGAEGLLALRKQGARTFAQDEGTCAIFGMPRVAMELGAAEEMVALPDFASRLFKAVRQWAAPSGGAS